MDKKNKNIGKNYVYNLIYQIFTLIIPLITTPYVSRVLEADGVGTYGYILSIVTYFVLFGSLGVAMYGQREIAYHQTDKEKISKIFYEIIIMRFITLTIAFLAYLLIFTKNLNNGIFYKIFALEIIANMFDISWFFQGLEEFKKTVTRNIIVKTISVICIFVFVKLKSDLNIYILIYVLSNLIGHFSLWLYLPMYITKIKLRKIRFWKILKPTILLFIPQIAIQIYTVLDKTMIGIILNDMSEVGYYEQSQKILKMILAIIAAFGTVMAPRIASVAAQKNNEKIKEYLVLSFRVVWVLGFPLMFGIMGISNNFVPWFYGEGYDKVKIILFSMAPIIIAIGLSNVTGIQYLTQVKKQKILTISVCVGALTNLIFNILLIPIFKSIGAGIASIIAEIITTVIQFIYIKKDNIIEIKYIFKMAIKYCISGLVMFVCIFILGYFLNVNIIGTIIQIFAGCLVYFIMLVFILKDEFCNEFMKKIYNKIRRKTV